MKTILALLALSLSPAAFAYDGWVEAANCTAISGWAFDPNRPNTPINIDLYDGSNPIVTITAANFRQDLLNAGIGNGYHAFSLLTPNGLKDGAQHIIYAYQAGSMVPIGNSGAFAVNCSAPAPGYQPYYSDTLNAVNTTWWTQTGAVTAQSNGITSTGTGALISNYGVPGGVSDYEVRTTLNLTASGGTYYLYLRASPDANADANTGTFYAAVLSNPTYSGTTCTATLSIVKRVSGAITSLLANTVPCHAGMVLRAVAMGGSFALYIDSTCSGWINDASIATGQPGIGLSYAPAANSISKVALGPREHIAPAPINAQTIAAWPLPNRIDFQWQSPLDDPNGTGVAYYQIFRNGQWFASTSQPTLSDTAVSPGTTYSYLFQAIDYHWNASNTTISVTTPPAGSIDARRVGVRPTGSYWGGAGEQIDMVSGNLNFTIPLVKVQGRGGWGVGFNLSYNSQNWRQDPAGTWQLGRDTGYGYGWRLQAGSLTPVYQAYLIVHHYLFIDGTGAEYRLDQNNGGVWTSKESIYVSYDSTAQRLYFTDGSFWVFGALSAGTEQDTGTQYPTLMQDTNGNQILIRYNPGIGVTWPDSSARIQQIEDVRATGGPSVYSTYNFTFNTDPIPHLTGIQNNIGTAEKYTFAYTTGALLSPFSPSQNFGNWSFLQSMNQTGTGLTTSFAYDGSQSGELTQTTFPYGGHLRWVYTPFTFIGSRIQREIGSRFISTGPGAPETQHVMGRDTAADTGRTAHYYANWVDIAADAGKVWVLRYDGTQFNVGLPDSYYERRNSDGLMKDLTYYTWAQDPAGNPYISAAQTILDPNQPYAVTKKATQTLDQYGNVTQMQVFDYGNLTTPVRTYTNTYLADPNYTSRFIRNRLVSSTVNDLIRTVSLVQNHYDQYFLFCGSGMLSDVAGVREHDATYGTGFTYRGNLTASFTPGVTPEAWNTGVRPAVTTCRSFDITGAAASTTVNGVTTSVATNSSTNWAAPSAITTNSLTNSLTWTSFLGTSSQTGANGDAAQVFYDANARPTSTVSPYGATTTYAYNDTASPPTKTATTNGHWVRTTMDGFGRTIKAETGDATTTKSVVDTVYAPCGCSPLGKMKQVSQPHAPGAAQYWTTYTYDAIGRTVSVLSPDGASTKSYAYQGNTVTTTDPAGNWKTFTSDAMGNLTQVAEPRPGGGSYTTLYAYDVLNHLIQVSMPRDGATQIRTFNYIDPATNNPGAFLRSAANPETGTVSYTYNAVGLAATKTDARGIQLGYSYDGYNRLSQVSTAGSALRTYYYDANPFDPAFSQYTLGRLAAILHAPSPIGQFIDMYSYTLAGQPSKKRMQFNQTLYGDGGINPVTRSLNIDAGYGYDSEGKMTSVSYPNTYRASEDFYPVQVVANPGRVYSYSYDTMHRPTGMTDDTNALFASNVQYGPANELLSINYLGVAETRTYNSMLQLTSLNASNLNLQYRFSATQNNGKITSQKDMTSGEEVQYTYDSLTRLIAASTTAASDQVTTPWGQSFGYDGFGNLNAKSVTKGSAPTMSISIDPATNRIVGRSYDANGNLLSLPAGGLAQYDAENRLISVPGLQYGYDASNKRVWKWDGSVNGNSNVYGIELYFYGIDGKRMGTYVPGFSNHNVQGYAIPPVLTDTATDQNLYFTGKLIAHGIPGALVPFTQDRLGSAAKTYPYGEEKTPNGQDGIKFATYTRDTATNLDYADQRFYSSQWGRFMSPDQGAPRLSNPQSWNRYSYVGNDPINFNDPDGMLPASVSVDFGSSCSESSYAGGTVDASRHCPPGSVDIAIQGTSSSKSLTFQVADAFERVGDLVDDWEYDGNSGRKFKVYMSGRTYEDLVAAGFQGSCGCAPGEWLKDRIEVKVTLWMLGQLAALRSRTPIRGEPDSVQTFPSKNGKTVRVYGEDGRAIRDIDYGDQSHSGFDPEVHDWDWSSGSPERSKVGRAPLPGEIP